MNEFYIWRNFLTSYCKKVVNQCCSLQTKTYQNDQINKQTDQMYTLLAICLVLHPQRIDESLHSMLKEKNYAEKMNKMSQGDLAEFEACFTFACPKFLSPVPPSFDLGFGPQGGVEYANLHKEPLRLQMNVFMGEVKQQLLLPTIRFVSMLIIETFTLN